MRGRFYELDDNENSLFFEIHVCPYDEKQLERLKSLHVLPSSRIGEFLKLIKEPIPSGTYFLYKLQTYRGEKGIKDSWEFNSKISDYKEFGFFSIENLLKFCRDTWGIAKEDFKPIEETNIPC